MMMMNTRQRQMIFTLLLVAPTLVGFFLQGRFGVTPGVVGALTFAVILGYFVVMEVLDRVGTRAATEHRRRADDLASPMATTDPLHVAEREKPTHNVAGGDYDDDSIRG